MEKMYKKNHTKLYNIIFKKKKYYQTYNCINENAVRIYL